MKTTVKRHIRKSSTGKRVVVRTHKRKTNPARKQSLKQAYFISIQETLLDTGRPVTTSELANHLGMHQTTITKYIEELERLGQVRKTIINGRTYWKA